MSNFIESAAARSGGASTATKVTVMRNEIELTDEQIEARFEERGYHYTIDDLVFTRDTMDDFRANPKGHIVADDGRVIEMGHDPVCVIDFGTVRAVAQ